MKNFIQILADAGIELTEEQKTAIDKAVSENYKTIADYQKQARKVETAEEQLKTAQETLDKFKDIDPQKIQEELETYKKAAKDAEEKAAAEILKRDQMDYLKGKFDGLGIDNKRIRESLAGEVIGDLKWKDGEFMGLDDYLKKINDEEHLYKTAEEKETEEKQNQARQNVPKFTEPSTNDKNGKKETVPIIW